MDIGSEGLSCKEDRDIKSFIAAEKLFAEAIFKYLFRSRTNAY